MTDAEKLAALRRELQPVLSWYRKMITQGSPDGDADPNDYVYDMAWGEFQQRLSRGNFHAVLQILS